MAGPSLELYIDKARGLGGLFKLEDRYLVSSIDHATEQKRQATTQRGHADAQQTSCPWDTPHAIPVSQGTAVAFRDNEDNRRSLERVLHCTNPRRRQPPHYVLHARASVPTQHKSFPQGYALSQDGNTRRFDEIVNDFPNSTKCIVGICLWADTLEESFFQICRWLDIFGRHRTLIFPKRLSLALARRNLLASSSLRSTSSPTTNISAQSMNFLLHKHH